MKKILLSIGSLVFAGAVLAGGTGALVSTTQTSTGNTFATGVIDLLVDNESYVTSTTTGALVFSPSTSWASSTLAGKLFFNFADVKPGDIGEDTISLHVNNNDAWACMKITLTGTPDNGIVDPEAKAGDTTNGPNQGELQNALQFAFWADDGDNVYEKGEKIFKEGSAKKLFTDNWWTLTDSRDNIWKSKSSGYSCDSGGNWHGEESDCDYGHCKNGTGDPLKGDTTVYIGKVWCFGTLVATPVNQDGKGKTGTNGPLVRGTGFTCNGKPVGNIYQSDGINVDVSFTAVQSRDNKSFKCSASSSSEDDKSHSEDY